MKKKITLKHIARELDVSISTVSKALKNSEEISKDTKEKVQAFAKLYNYKPNNIAVSLKNKQTRTIGVIIPNIVHHFFTTVFRGIEKYASTRGYNVVVCVSDESFNKEVINMEMLANGSVDGFIMSLSGETQQRKDYNHLKEVTEQGIPLVLFDRVTDEIECDKVIIDDRDISFKAVSNLVDSGRKRIALISTDDYFSVSKERAQGYKDALLAHNIKVDENLVLILSFDNNDANEGLLRRFFDQNKIDAALCVNEIFAILGMAIAQELGFIVPKDIAFMGFTDGILSKFSRPSLTTVAQHGDKMGEIAAKMLIERIESSIDEEEEVFRTEIVKATIIARESTDNYIG